jgi:hypothetical protein
LPTVLALIKRAGLDQSIERLGVRRREPRPAAPYYKKHSEAKDHAFDRERGGDIPASWLKSHAQSLVRYHLHLETKFQGGEYDQRGPLKRRHVFALAQQSIGKEADNIEENEFIGEDAGPPTMASCGTSRPQQLQPSAPPRIPKHAPHPSRGGFPDVASRDRCVIGIEPPRLRATPFDLS